MLDGAKRDRQRGEGKLGGIISLLALGCFIFALVNVGPAYFADYNLGDQMREVARLARGRYSDDEIKDKLMRAVTDSGLEAWVDRSSCSTSSPAAG